MTAYGAPGVFVNQTPAPVAVSAGNIPGQAVATFAANYNAGPTVPVFVTSWQSYQQLFGGFKSGSTSMLPYAVYQYFSNGGTGCYVFRVPNSDATQAALSIADANGPELAAPVLPVPTTSTTGGTVLAGTYKVEVTYVNTDGETTPSPSATIVTTGSTSTITIPSPVAELNATGWYAYVTQAGGSTYTRQQTAGSPTAIGTNLTISAPPTSSGANPPTQNTTGVVSMVVTSLYPGAWGNTIYITITPTSGTSTGTFNLQVYQGGAGATFLVESWNGVSLNPTAARYAPAMINSTTSGSSYIKITGYATGSNYIAGTSDPYTISSPVALGTATGAAQPGIVSSVSGIDGTTPIDLSWAITAGQLGSAPGSTPAWNQGNLASLQGQILNLNLPDASANGSINYTLVNNIITWATGVGNVYLIVDGFFNGGFASSSTVASTYTSMTQGALGSTVNASTIASIYGPWLSITDPASGTAGATKWVPPSGAVLGYWAVNDNQFNVAQSPAGTAAVVNAVALEAYFTPTDLTNLESAQINPIKVIQNAGFCIFGALTTSPGYPNRYLNISRTLMKIQHDLQYITAFAVFQNNTPVLWQSMATAITNYLTTEMQAKLLAGSSPSTAFQVVCDSTNNTPATVAAGQVNATVAVAVSAPAEFVVINLTQMASGATTTISS